MARTRKIRNDRFYIIYMMEAPDGEFYIGLTSRIGQAVQGTLKTRVRRHWSKARTAGKDWSLHEKIREFPVQKEWNFTVIDGVRGRKDAYALEREYIIEQQPSLNTF